ncbi:MAG TPA: DUF4232 domain-containing protein [Trebonia sp.]|jgi:hypothetical protein|nr:DUF4232 domain-containing protein [Trebonia sp.]
MALNVHIARNSLTAGMVAAASILAVGCGSHSSSAPVSPAGQASAPSSSVSAASTPTSIASGQASSSVPATHTGGAPAGAAACSSSNLRISLSGGGAAAGTDFTVIDFTNSGTAPCTLYGFPGVSLTNSSGAQIGAAATRNPSKASTLVTLAPGAKASAELGVANALNYPTDACKPMTAAQLKVFPPNQTQAIEAPFTATGCSVSSTHQLSVTAVAGAQQ